jgi:hypothetical protein
LRSASKKTPQRGCLFFIKKAVFYKKSGVLESIEGGPRSTCFTGPIIW